MDTLFRRSTLTSLGGNEVKLQDDLWDGLEEGFGQHASYHDNTVCEHGNSGAVTVTQTQQSLNLSHRIQAYTKDDELRFQSNHRLTHHTVS